MAVYRGACHCGAVQFQIDSEITDVYTCDCSLCAKKNALMTTVPEDKFVLLSGETALSLYQWNTKVARNYFCSMCGIYPFHRKRSMPDHYRPEALWARSPDGDRTGTCIKLAHHGC